MRDIRCTTINRQNFYDIVEDILENEEYVKIKTITHHGMNRYEHNVRVSYYSYLVAKYLHLDFESTARGGALHDFFISCKDDDTTFKDRIKFLESHPSYALLNANYYFDLNEKEKDIILTHMFPIVLKRVPKYMESWIVDIVDNWVSFGEKIYTTRKSVSKYANSVYTYANKKMI